MREAEVVQVGTPDELWAHPADTDVARFLGLANVRDGTVVRPEAVTVRHIGAGDAGDGVVESLVRHGPTVRLTVRLDDGSELDAAVTSLEHPAPGERLGRDRSRRHRSRVIRRRVVVHGFVQVCSFATRSGDARQPASGWVRNNRDGTVEAVFEGEDAAVERLVGLPRRPPGSPRGSCRGRDRGARTAWAFSVR